MMNVRKFEDSRGEDPSIRGLSDKIHVWFFTSVQSDDCFVDLREVWCVFANVYFLWDRTGMVLVVVCSLSPCAFGGRKWLMGIEVWFRVG